MIKIEKLVKKYGTRTAVDNISFCVDKGEIVGFLGPNGAGKTTTMRIIAGYLKPTDGSVSVAELDMSTHSLEARSHIGYMPEIVPLYTDMTTTQYLTYVAKLRGMTRKTIRSRIGEVVELCHLEEYVHTILGKLSKGFRQRVGIAQAVIHEPDVLILDEPTAGIDPIQVAQTRELIKTLGKERTILLSTHILPEISMICERVIIIHKGKIVAEDRIDNLSALLKRGHTIRLQIDGPPEEVSARLREINMAEAVEYQAPYHRVDYSAEESPHGDITRLVVQNGWTLRSMETEEMDLESIFLNLTTEEQR